jgi:hypothetical protein
MLFHLIVYSQENNPGKTRFVIGAAGPELFHAGVTYRVANINQLGLNAGLGPSLGSVWTAISIEDRVYFGRSDKRTNQKNWFCRVGTTFFPQAESPQRFTFNLTAGKDLLFKNQKNGITIDAGVFYLQDSEGSSIILIPSLDLWPALRVQFYFSL